MISEEWLLVADEMWPTTGASLVQHSGFGHTYDIIAACGNTSKKQLISLWEFILIVSIITSVGMYCKYDSIDPVWDLKTESGIKVRWLFIFMAVKRRLLFCCMFYCFENKKKRIQSIKYTNIQKLQFKPFLLLVEHCASISTIKLNAVNEHEPGHHIRYPIVI